MDTIRSQRLAGASLFIGNTAFFLGLAAAESVFPGYSVSSYTISDLGAPIELALNPPGLLTIQQPASIIYVLSLVALSVFSIEAAWLFRRTFRAERFWKIFFVFAASLIAIAASYVPYYVYEGQQISAPVSNVPTALLAGGLVHDAASGLAFFFGGLSAINSRKLVSKPLDTLFTVAGAVAIAAAGLSGIGVNLGLGSGGVERIVAYPILVWALAFSGSLIGATSQGKPKDL